MITVKKVTTKRELKVFLKFPFSLYKDSKYWVPPIISQEIENFNTKTNPVFKHAEAHLFLAYKNNRLVGRVAAILNWKEIKNQQKKMRFGWFDFIDDIEVSKRLLDEVKKLGEANNLEYMEGPVGFSNMDKVGVLVEGFNHIGNMITWYNYPYYVNHFKAHDFTVEKEYLEHKFPFSNIDPKNFTRVQALIKKRYKLETVTFKKSKEIMPYANAMFDLFNKSYANLSSFVKISEAQKRYFKKKFIPFINPEYVKFVIDESKNLIAFAIVMPSYAEALQKAKGRLFPFGFRHLLKAKKNSKTAVFYLIGVLPEYQNKGVTALIFDEFYKTFSKKGIHTCIRTPELADNEAIHKIWRHFNPVVFKRRQTFKKML